MAVAGAIASRSAIEREGPFTRCLLQPQVSSVEVHLSGLDGFVTSAEGDVLSGCQRRRERVRLMPTYSREIPGQQKLTADVWHNPALGITPEVVV